MQSRQVRAQLQRPTSARPSYEGHSIRANEYLGRHPELISSSEHGIELPLSNFRVQVDVQRTVSQRVAEGYELSDFCYLACAADWWGQV
jgi:hypothetical protein